MKLLLEGMALLTKYGAKKIFKQGKKHVLLIVVVGMAVAFAVSVAASIRVTWNESNRIAEQGPTYQRPDDCPQGYHPVNEMHGLIVDLHCVKD